MLRPEINEYNPYFQKYLDMVGNGKFGMLYEENTESVAEFFSDINPAKHEYRYAPGKWTPKEVLMHLIDTDRVFAYRALVCLRGDTKTQLQTMDENMYAANADVSNREMGSLVVEFLIQRHSMKMLFENATPEQQKFICQVSGHPISARALGYIIIGHATHHKNIVLARYL